MMLECPFTHLVSIPTLAALHSTQIPTIQMFNFTYKTPYTPLASTHILAAVHSTQKHIIQMSKFALGATYLVHTVSKFAFITVLFGVYCLQ